MFGQDIFYSHQQDTVTQRDLEVPTHSYIQPQLFLDLSRQFVQNNCIVHLPLEQESTLQFTDINFFSSEAPQLQEESEPEQTIDRKKSTESHPSKKKSNNTICYILKHCLKKMLSEQKKKQINCYCQEFGLDYKDFKDFWTSKLGDFKRGHFGSSKFREFMREEGACLQIFRYFMIVYLKLEYIMHLSKSKVENKQEYITCSIRLAILCGVESIKSYRIIKQAQSEFLQ